MELSPTLATPSLPASRRVWLKGVGALPGTGLPAAPAALLAAPAATPLAGDEPVGVVKLLAGPALPIGWSRCDGRVLPVAEHPAPFAVMGAAHGGAGMHPLALPQLGVPAVGAGSVAKQFALKTANGPATTTGLAERRHSHWLRARIA